MNIVPLNYKGEAIRFNTDGWINATDIAKRFGKRLDHWLSNAETLEYVRALDEVYSGEPSKILHTRDSGYVKTSKARKDRGGEHGCIQSYQLPLQDGAIRNSPSGATCTLIACFVVN